MSARYLGGCCGLWGRCQDRTQQSQGCSPRISRTRPQRWIATSTKFRLTGYSAIDKLHDTAPNNLPLDNLDNLTQCECYAVWAIGSVNEWFLIHLLRFRGHSGGIRSGTRYAFSRDFRKKGMIPLSTYLKTYRSVSFLPSLCRQSLANHPQGRRYRRHQGQRCRPEGVSLKEKNPLNPPRTSGDLALRMFIP